MDADGVACTVCSADTVDAADPEVVATFGSAWDGPAACDDIGLDAP